MKYCSHCGHAVEIKVPEGDNRERHICIQCETIHYQNPKIVAGCLAAYENKVLLCKRAIEPRYGFWTLPAGFMENGETTWQAAERETHEEAGAQVDIHGLYTLHNLPHISQVYMFFRASLVNLDFKSGQESLDTQLFTEEEIPWKEIAFPTVTETLAQYFDDLKTGNFELTTKDIVPPYTSRR